MILFDDCVLTVYTAFHIINSVVHIFEAVITIFNELVISDNSTEMSWMTFNQACWFEVRVSESTTSLKAPEMKMAINLKTKSEKDRCKIREALLEMVVTLCLSQA